MPARPSLPALARKAAEDPVALEDLLQALRPENKKLAVRERAFKALMALAQIRPELLLRHWNGLKNLLVQGGAFSKYPAIHLIAALVPADRQRRFDRSFAAFFNLLDDDAVSVAAHTARQAGTIAVARPDLEPRDHTPAAGARPDALRSRAARPREELRARGFRCLLRNLRQPGGHAGIRRRNAAFTQSPGGQVGEGLPQETPERLKGEQHSRRGGGAGRSARRSSWRLPAARPTSKRTLWTSG